LELLFQNEINLLYTICVSWKNDHFNSQSESSGWDKLLRGELPNQHPLIQPLSTIWDTVLKVHEKFLESLNISSSICSLIKSATLAARNDFTPLLRSSLELLAKALRTCQNENVLNIVPVIFSTYSDPKGLENNPQTVRHLLEFFEAIFVCIAQFASEFQLFYFSIFIYF
jgi:hypothetical protein